MAGFEAESPGRKLRPVREVRRRLEIAQQFNLQVQQMSTDQLLARNEELNREEHELLASFPDGQPADTDTDDGSAY